MLFVLASVGGLAILLGLYIVPKWQVKTFESESKANLENEFRKTLAQIVGGLAVIVGLYFGWQQLKAASESLEVTREGQITDRYSKAVEQLGSDKLQVQLGGIYALGEISRDPEHDHYWSVVDVLAGFVRDSAAWRSPELPSDIKVSVQAALSVIATRDSHHTSGMKGLVVDLNHTDLRRAFLEDAFLARARLNGTHLDFADCSSANFEQANFSNAFLINSVLQNAKMDGADLTGADLTGARLSGAHLRNAILNGSLLYRADLKGADLEGADFSEARVDGAHLEGANLKEAIGLSMSQLHSASIDKETVIPASLK